MKIRCRRSHCTARDRSADVAYIFLSTMVSIPLNNPPEAKDRHPAALPTGVVVSLLLHVAPVLLFLLFGLWPRSQPEHKSEFVMEMVQLPEPKPPVVQPPPQPQPQLLPRPLVPQLTEAPIAEKSTPPPQSGQIAAPARARPAPHVADKQEVTAPGTSLPANTTRPDAAQMAIGRAEPSKGFDLSGKNAKPATQAFQDFILMQISRHWIIDFRGPRYRDVVLTGTEITVLPNGMLASPLNKNDPWNPAGIVSGYDQLGSAERTIVDTFLQAMRLAQPFRLPPDGKDGQSRVFSIRFRLGDLPPMPTGAG